MAMSDNPPQITIRELSYVWQILWNMVYGFPETTVRADLQRQLGFDTPEKTTLGCLRTYEDEKMIKCINDDTVIRDAFKESDFNQFALMAEGTKRGPLYIVPKK